MARQRRGVTIAATIVAVIVGLGSMAVSFRFGLGEALCENAPCPDYPNGLLDVGFYGGAALVLLAAVRAIHVMVPRRPRKDPRL